MKCDKFTKKNEEIKKKNFFLKILGKLYVKFEQFSSNVLSRLIFPKILRNIIVKIFVSFTDVLHIVRKIHNSTRHTTSHVMLVPIHTARF